MSQNPEGASAHEDHAAATTDEGPATPPADTKPEKSPFERRVFIFKATFFLGGVAALAYGYYRQRRIREMTDNDPTDPRGGGRGQSRPKNSNSDNDPSDPEGGSKKQRQSSQPQPGAEPKTEGPPAQPKVDAEPKTESPPAQPKADGNP